MLQDKKLKKWMKNIDGTFGTLIIPISIIISVVWGFLFFYGQAVTSEYMATLRMQLLSSLTFQLAIFIVSVTLWCVSIFVENMKWKILTKWLSLNALWVVFLLAPVAILSSYFVNAYNLRVEDVAVIYALFLAFLMVLMVRITIPPKWKT